MIRLIRISGLRKNRMDTRPNHCSISRSRCRWFVVFLLLATPALAQENATAYEALRVVGSELGKGALNHIVSITGVKGDPQPKKWKIILEDPIGRASCRERVRSRWSP